ncbi:BACON domain-containing carbohydrate-binding protein [Bacteroides sp. GD17]|jgi:hypothetical protein|uniref:BACON domain-containing protein n=1 Tax=Bacteroides sp. GD17 TaxID=3139826 RepID=UPI0025E75339|nr:BACON domain-containing carbohydrate-binding protein [uncultured Bacteroides sp.]
MNSLKMKLLFWLVVSAAIFSSCSAEDENYSGHTSGTGKEIDVQVLFQMPAASPKTRAISEVDENLVEEIDVLAFEPDGVDPSKWVFSYSAQGHTIQDVAESNPTKSKKQFTVKLIKSDAPQTFVILANVRSELTALGEIGKGADKDELLARLLYSRAGSWNANNDKDEDASDKNFDSFPMWGEVEATLTDAVTRISDVKLLRAIARFDVVLDNAVVTAGNFTLDEVYVYNSKNQGRIVPEPGNLESLSKVKAATEPTGSINNDTPLFYEVPSSMNTAFERTIYLFEAKGKDENESSKATCVVVGGTYGTDGKTTYYRLDFLKKESTDTYYRDILRNHKYVMNIQSVTGSGYDTPDKAFKSKSFNMEAEVQEWDDSGMNNSIFDGHYQLTVNKDSLYFYSEGRARELKVYTDYPDGWTIEDLPSWLTVTPSSGAAGDKVDIQVTADPHTIPMDDRESYFYITAGRFKQKIKVVQTVTPELTIDVNKNSLVFRKSGSSGGKSIIVTTYPNDANVYFTEVPGSNAIDWASGGFPDSGYANITTYVFKPAKNESGSSKTTSVIVYVMGPDGTRASKTIDIMQLATDLLFNVTKQDYYPETAGTNTFSVDSDTDWYVYSVDDLGTGVVSNWSNTNNDKGVTTYSFDLTINETWDNRKAIFKVASSDPDFAGQEIVIIQGHANPTIKLNVNALDFGTSGDSKSVTVTSNAKWKYAVSTGNWANTVATASVAAGTESGNHTYQTTTGTNTVTFTPKAWTAAAGTPASGNTTAVGLQFTTTDHDPATASTANLTINRTVPAFFTLNTGNTSAARAGQNIAVNVSTNAAWNATSTAGTSIAAQAPAAYGTRSVNINIPANTTWASRTVTVSTKYGINTSSISTAKGSFAVTQTGYYISAASRNFAPSPSVATNANITLTGAYPQMNVRVLNVTANAQLAATTIAARESGAGTSNNISVAANATWANRVLRIQYQHPVNGWTPVGGDVTQEGYSTTGLSRDNVTPIGGGFVITVRAQSYLPNLQLRAISGGTVVSTTQPTIAGGTTNLRTQTLTIGNNPPPGAREVQVQYYHPIYGWTNLGSPFVQPEGNYVLTTGRIVALQDIPSMYGSATMTWTDAMGIPAEYTYKLFGGGMYYTPNMPTGCGSYSEPGYPAGTWRLPTIDEVDEIAANNWASVAASKGYWSCTEDGPSDGAARARGINGGRVSKNGTYFVRCVRWP